MEKMLVPAGLVVICSAVLLIVRMVLFKLLLGWARRTETQIDDIVIASLRLPSIFWAVAVGVSIGIGLSELPVKYAAGITLAVSVLLIVSATIACANLAGRIFSSFIQSKQLPFPSTGLAYGVIKGAIYLVGFLVMLAQLGISIAPLLTALGVGGLAVALALQDTLANVFAGIHILVERSIRVGDFIRLESGQEGYVDDITWRTTRVRMLPNNMVVIPNSKLAQSVVTNYYLPEKRMSLLMPISVAYAADPDHIERILVEEAKEGAKHIPGLLAEPEPFVRFIPGFGESSLDFTLICQVVEFTDQYLAQHELRKSIFRRFRREGIEIPFPQRTIHLREERSER
ncbi:MAG: mechanosensitive ion channel family protein [Nitrospirota bacterium]